MSKQLSSDVQKQAEELAHLRQQIASLRVELDYANRIRNVLGQSLRGLWQSRFWRFCTWIRWFSPVRKKPVAGISELVPLSDSTRAPDGSWEGTGLPMLLAPIFPRRGWLRLRAELWSSVSSRAHLYVDSGQAFNPGEVIDLGLVHGQTTLDEFVYLPTTAHLLRFDPIRQRGRFHLIAFSITPASAFEHFRAVVWANLLKVLCPLDHRPSILIGLKLLLTGQWGRFTHQLHINASAKNVESIHASDYEIWRENRQINEPERRRMRQEISDWTNPPRISIILPVFNTPESYLRECIQSVCNQIYPHWELCIADDASTEPHVRRVIDEFAGRDPRIKVIYRQTNGNISATSNSALSMATGQYIALLDHDDTLADHALFRIAQAIVGNPSSDIFYSDEDKLSADGKLVEPFFKPDWSPEFFLACMYTCHLGAYRTDSVRQVGGWRTEFDGAQDYDLMLRMLADGAKVQHIPDVLYHWRIHQASTASSAGAKPKAHEIGRRAIEEYLAKIGRLATLHDGPAPTFHAVCYHLTGKKRISVIIPSACKPISQQEQPDWLVRRCVQSIRNISTFPDIEILVLDRCNMSRELQGALNEMNVRRITYDFDFNWSRVNNHGAAAATGDFLLFLNDDMEVITPDGLQWMAGYAQWPEIGAVGAMLLFPDNTLQHTGVILPGGNPTHPFYKFPSNHPGQFWSNQIHRNWSAVTGACLMTRADLFNKIGGFDERFPLNFNDVEYGLRLISRGLRVVYTPHAKLYHFESTTRKAEVRREEVNAIHDAWNHLFHWDPYYSPHLAMGSSDYRINPESALEPEPACIIYCDQSAVSNIKNYNLNWTTPVRLAEA